MNRRYISYLKWILEFCAPIPQYINEHYTSLGDHFQTLNIKPISGQCLVFAGVLNPVNISSTLRLCSRTKYIVNYEFTTLSSDKDNIWDNNREPRAHHFSTYTVNNVYANDYENFIYCGKFNSSSIFCFETCHIVPRNMICTVHMLSTIQGIRYSNIHSASISQYILRLDDALG